MLVSTHTHRSVLTEARIFFCREGMSVCISKYVLVRICACAKASVCMNECSCEMSPFEMVRAERTKGREAVGCGSHRSLF